jgi:hypothetical protein
MKYIKEIFLNLLRAFGVLWLVVEIASFFNNELAIAIKSYWWMFLLLGLGYPVYHFLFPKRRFKFKINNKDITIELVIGDIFKEQGPIIIGSNTRFVISSDIISSSSIQGLFSDKYFADREEINKQIKLQIKDEVSSPFGTTITIKSTERTGYFCAIADINQNGVARSNVENIRVSLAGLWSYLSSNAEKDILNIPILGSGFSRVSTPREDLVKEIIRSFIASTSDHTFCDGIRLVIYKKDIKKYDINVDQLVDFIKYSCIYSIVPAVSKKLVGTAEE